jgi:hypothetical protein
VATMAWAAFQVLANRCVEWEKEEGEEWVFCPLPDTFVGMMGQHGFVFHCSGARLCYFIMSHNTSGPFHKGLVISVVLWELTAACGTKWYPSLEGDEGPGILTGEFQYLLVNIADSLH